MDSRRREERIPVRLSLRVWGMDANGKPFSENTTTLDITRNGARLSSLPVALKQGEIIGVQHGNEKARFRVAWVGAPGTGRAGQVGIVCLESTKYIWGKPLHELRPPKPQGNARPALGPVLPPQPVAAPKASERRDSTRYVCTGGAEFKNIENGFTNWGTVTDVSEAGCYVETMYPLPAKSMVDFKLHVRNFDVFARAVVRSSDPNVGMGIEFIQLSPEDRERLIALISTLSIVPNPASRAVPSAPNVVGTDTPPVTRTLGPSPSKPAEPSASDKLRLAAQQLREAGAAIESGTSPLEPQALAEFLFAIDYAWETAFDRQSWLRTSAVIGSSKLIDELRPALVRTLATLTREFIAQADSGSLDADTVTKLRSTIAELHRRLAGVSVSAPGQAPITPS